MLILKQLILLIYKFMTIEAPANKKDHTFLISLVLLIFSLAINGVVYSYNYYINKNIEGISSSIEQSKTAINNLKKNEKIRIYNLVDLNKKNIAILDKKSNIVEYIEHFKSIKSKYWIEFTGFNYSDWKITTNALAENKALTLLSRKSASYIKVADFIEKYRLDTDKDAKFNLPFITTINWQSEMKFDVNFEVK